MRFLTALECQEWCALRGFPTHEVPGFIGGYLARLQSQGFHFVEFELPVDSGQKVRLAGFLYSLLEPSAELLIWLGSCDVWESSQHMPLFTRLRQALGENRGVLELPGHVAKAAEADDAISIMCLSLLFIWDCLVSSDSGRDAVFTSHDEFGWFATRDPAVAAAAQAKISATLQKQP
jgi:hypothetical protein